MTLFSPSSIAVIGASADEGSVGYAILHNLLNQGYEGNVFPVNPKRDSVQGVACFKSIIDIPETVELAVIVVPAKIVPAVLEEVGEKEVPNAVIISAGFSETHSSTGEKLEKEIIDITAKYGINMIGPNCLGILRPSAHMNASFAAELPPAGKVSLISQSGALAVAVMDSAKNLGIGFSNVISIGNKATMDESHMVKLCAQDPETAVLGLYLENIKDGEKFYKEVASVTPYKPIILLKAGVSEHGSKAAASHTGALAGSDAGIEALCKQTGVKRARSMEEFLDMLEVCSAQPPLLSNRIAIITNAGGPGILATDAAEAANLHLPELSEKVATALKKELPESASIGNPIDVIGDADEKRFSAALTACGDDAQIDGVCVIVTPQTMTPCDKIADVIMSWKKAFPLMPVTTAFIGDTHIAKARDMLQSAGVPSFETPERAIAALAALQKVTATERGETSELRSTRAREIVHSEQGRKRTQLSEESLHALCKLYDIKLPAQTIATTPEEAKDIAEEITYPVIAKISSPEILHKTDVGGIKANIQNAEELEDAWDTIMTNVTANAPKAHIDGLLIQKFFDAGSEFIVGALRDPSFGPLVMVGLGGIYTELLNDTAFRIAPISQTESYRMLEELTSWKVLLGMRGKEQLCIDELALLLEKISQLTAECPEIAELDINPVILKPDELIIADMKIVIEER